MAGGADAPAARAWWIALAIVGAAALACVWIPAYPAGMDMPVHLLSADVLARPAAYAGRFDGSLARTSQGFVWLVAAGRALGLPLLVAAKVALSALLALYVTAFAALGAAAGQRRPAGAILGAGSFASFALAMGFANFALAVPVGVLAVAATVRACEDGRGRVVARWAPVGLLLLATAALHAIVAACAIVQVGATALLAPGGTARLRAVLHAVVAALPATAYGAAAAVAARTSAGWDDVAAQLGVHRLPATEQIAIALDGPWGGFSALGGMMTALVLVGCLGRRDRWLGYIAATAAFWLLAFAALPWHAEGWAFAQPRVLAFALGVPAALAAWGPRPTLRLAGVTAATTLYLLSWGTGAADASRQVEAVVGGFDPVEGAEVTALVASGGYVSANEHVLPLLHASAFAAIDGAWMGDRYRFNPTIHSVAPVPRAVDLPESLPQYAFRPLARCQDEAACLAAIRELTDLAAVRARGWPALVVVGAAPPVRAALQRRGLVDIDPRTGAPDDPGAIVRLVPARALMSLALPDGFDGPLELRVGYPATVGWFDGVSTPGGPLPPGPVPLANLPAGPTTFELRTGETVLARVEVSLAAGATTEVALDAASR